MTIEEYWDALKAHDWYYQYSDDGRVYNRGHGEQTRLCALSHNSEDPRFKELWEAFCEAHNPTSGVSTVPARPE